MGDNADKDDVAKLVDAILKKGQHPKQADVLIRLAKSATLFHTPAPNADAYADIVIKGRRETHRTNGRSQHKLLMDKRRHRICVSPNRSPQLFVG